MRVCYSCGRENPDDRDFCECGEYLRWDPTGVVQAITPEVLQAAQQEAPPAAAAPPADAPAQRAAAGARRRAAAPRRRSPRPRPAAAAPAARPAATAGARPPSPATRSPAPRRAPAPAARRARAAPSRPRRSPRVPAAPVPPPPPAAPAQPDEPDPAAISLRLPEGEQVTPRRDARRGRRARRPRPRARARAQPERHRRQLRAVSARTAGRLVVDLPQHRLPRAVRHQRHLRAGSGDPPPPAAHRRGRGADLGARGRRRVQGLQPPGRRRPAAPRHPAVRGVQDQALARARVRPQEGAVRRRGQEHGQRARSPSRSTPPTPTTSSTYKFTPATMEIPPGQSIRLEDAGQAAAPEVDRAPGGEAHPGLHQDGRGGRSRPRPPRTWSCPRAPRAPRARRARRARKPKAKGLLEPPPRRRARAPRSAPAACSVTGPRVAQAAGPEQERRPDEAQGARRRRPGAGDPAAAQPGRLPPEGVAAVVGRAAAAAADPARAAAVPVPAASNVVVPEVTGAKSTFEAEKKLTEAELKLAPATKEKVAPRRRPAPSSARRPAAGEKAKKDSEVAIEIAVGNGKVEVPNVVGKTQAEAEKILREEKLTIGQVSAAAARSEGQDLEPDPRGQGGRQGGQADRHLHRRPARQEEGQGQGRQEERRRRRRRRQGRGGALPALAGMAVAEAAQKAAEAGPRAREGHPVLRQEEGHADRHRSRRRAPSSRRAPRSSCSSPPASRSSRSTTARTSCSPTAPTASACPRSPRAPQEETDPTCSFDGTQVAYVEQPPRVPQGPDEARRAAGRR